MTAGVVSGLQNRFGVREASRVGSIPTRSRHVQLRLTAALLKVALIVCLMAVSARAAPALIAQETDPPASAVDSIARRADAPGDTVAAAADLLPAMDTLANVDSMATPGAAVSPVVTPQPEQESSADSAGVSPPVSPMGAFFRSLVLPGWGQVSVDQPGRGAFYFAMEAGSLWMLLKTNSKLNAARSADPMDEELVALREDQFEDWATLAVFWALFAGVDAWVSAQLWDFTGEVVPPPDGSPGAAFRYSIPVGP